jgi:hypothetical protein
MDDFITTKYFKEYRKELGFAKQDDVKKFFAAKDIIPTIDYNYINLLNSRLINIIEKINGVVCNEIKEANLKLFHNSNITQVFEKLRERNIIQKLNNQGRRPEEVYFSWMRGFVISNYFLKAICQIFEISISEIKLIGDDDLINIESFKRTPTADLEITLKNSDKLRIEVQSGFQGVNDIKQHKVLEAKRIFQKEEIPSLVIHFDLFNGQVAFVRLDTIEDDSINWITRQQMEGQTVFNIEQNYFIWKLTQNPPLYSDIIELI